MAFPSRVARHGSPYGHIPGYEYPDSRIKVDVKEYKELITGSETLGSTRVSYGWEDGAFVAGKIPGRVSEIAQPNGHNGKVHKLGTEAIKLVNGSEKANGKPKTETINTLGGITLDHSDLAASS